jgi:hypothetical protein
MLMNKQKYHRLILLLLLAAFSMPVLTAVTENPASEPTGTETPSEEPAPTAAQTGDVDQDTQQGEQISPPVNTPLAKPVKPFIPTEKIQADSAVSFPIDI